MRILNEPLKYEGPELKVLSSGSKRVDYYSDRIKESLKAVPKIRLYALGRTTSKMVTLIEKLKAILPNLTAEMHISRELGEPRLDAILVLK